jgi:hypothetical protein
MSPEHGSATTSWRLPFAVYCRAVHAWAAAAAELLGVPSARCGSHSARCVVARSSVRKLRTVAPLDNLQHQPPALTPGDRQGGSSSDGEARPP